MAYALLFKEYMWINLGQNSNWCPQQNMTLFASVHLRTNKIGVSLCDCIAGHIYYPAAEKCYSAYSRGPCERNEIFTPPANSTGTSKCIENKCAPDEGVWYQDECYKVGKPDSCELKRANIAVQVNPSTMELQCQFTGRASDPPKLFQPGDKSVDINSKFYYKCPDKGTRRHYLGAC